MVAVLLCGVLALCALLFWLGMRVQARRDFRAFASMFRAQETAASLPQFAWDVLADPWELFERTTDDDEPTVQQESDHYGVP